MKTYRIFAAFILLCLNHPAFAQFQPGDTVQTQYPECGYDYSCFHERAGQDEALKENEIERQEEEFEEIETENKKLEELKKNAEQPGLND